MTGPSTARIRQPKSKERYFMEPRNLTCIVCPMGCLLTVTEDADGLHVSGNT